MLSGGVVRREGVFKHLGRQRHKMVGMSRESWIEKRADFGYKATRAKSDPLGEVVPMEQFLLDVLAQIVAGLLVVLILRQWR